MNFLLRVDDFIYIVSVTNVLENASTYHAGALVLLYIFSTVLPRGLLRIGVDKLVQYVL